MAYHQSALRSSSPPRLGLKAASKTCFRVLAVVFTCCFFFSCGEKEEKALTIESPTIEPPALPENVDEIADTLWTKGEAALKGFVLDTQYLQTATHSFLSDPTQENLQSAQLEWSKAWLSYRKFFFFGHLGSAAPEKLSALYSMNFQIAAQPIQPGFLDSYGSYRYSGIVHDIGLKLSKEVLLAQHGLTDREEAILGLFAIEFMLFGENGTRNIENYTEHKTLNPEQIEKGFKKPDELFNNRRRKLLSLQTSLLAETAQKLLKTWQSNSPKSLKSSWKLLPAQEKTNTIHGALERSLTQLLINVVEMQQLDNQEAKENTPHRKAFVKPETQSNYIFFALDSTLLAVDFFEAKQRDKIQSHLQQAAATIQEKPTDTKEKTWGDIYQQLKLAADLVSSVELLKK